MTTKIMISNNTLGNHSADKWAMAAAETICDVSGLDGDNAIDGQRMLVKFADVLVKHFVHVQTVEQSKLQEDSSHILSDVWETRAIDLKVIAKELASAAAGGPWGDHYQRPEVKEAIINELRRLFATSRHVDRLAHAQRNPDCEHAQAYTSKVI